MDTQVGPADADGLHLHHELTRGGLRFVGIVQLDPPGTGEEGGLQMSSL